MPEPIPMRGLGGRAGGGGAGRAGGGPDLRGRRILLVEDEYMVAEDLRIELEEAGAEVVGPAPSVERALALLASEPAPPDAAILDVNLGGRMVFPVAEALRRRGVPFMFATGYDAWSLPPAFAEVPRCEKPFEVRECLEALFGPGWAARRERPPAPREP